MASRWFLVALFSSGFNGFHCSFGGFLGFHGFPCSPVFYCGFPWFFSVLPWTDTGQDIFWQNVCLTKCIADKMSV
jgi:hypothetical protein